MLSIIGLVLGIGLFIYASYKRVNIVLASLLACVLMAAFSKMPVYEMLMGPYMSGLSDFLNSYFLMILFSAVLGRLMNDGGGAKKIAVTFSKMVEHSDPQRQKFMCVLLVAALYYLFSYIGISGFVLVFTIMPIAKHLFHSTDTPWRLYCFGGVQNASSSMLIASLNHGNIYAADFCGTGTTAGPALSIIATALWWGSTLVLIHLFLMDAKRRHETFLTDGAAVLAATINDTDSEDGELPPLFLSLTPMLVVMTCTAIFKIAITKSLVIGCVVAIVLLYPQLKAGLKASLTKGVTDCYGSAFTVAALYGFGNVVKQIPGFISFTGTLSILPSMLQGSILGAAAAFIIAGSPIPIFGKQILDCYLTAGLSPALAHRMMTITGWTSIAPHSAGLSNSASVTKIDYGRCLQVYMTAAYVPGIIVTVVCQLLLSSGLIH